MHQLLEFTLVNLYQWYPKNTLLTADPLWKQIKIIFFQSIEARVTFYESLLLIKVFFLQMASFYIRKKKIKFVKHFMLLTDFTFFEWH